mgnify:CR=1 FL=1
MFACTRHTGATGPFFRRFVAVVGIALVLMLGISAASPSLHRNLHGDHGPDATSDNCAVVLFASGFTLAVAMAAVVAPRLVWRERIAPFVGELFLASPRYLRQPERGPPAT